jgi:hypothetical protein
MANRDRVLEYLSSVGHAGATNEQIVSHTGIRPHQQVFQITRDLMRFGKINGIQSGKEWRFWIGGAQTAMAQSEKPPQMQPLRSQNRLTPAEFEQLTLTAMTNVFGVPLAQGRIPGVPKLFDCLSEDGEIVGDAKYYTLVGGERLPPAKFATIAEHVWLLEKTAARRKFLAFGNDRRVPVEWLRRYGHLAETVEFFFIDHIGAVSRITRQAGHCEFTPCALKAAVRGPES